MKSKKFHFVLITIVSFFSSLVLAQNAALITSKEPVLSFEIHSGAEKAGSLKSIVDNPQAKLDVYMPPELEAKVEVDRATLKKHGYINRIGDPTKAEFALHKIAELEAIAEAAGQTSKIRQSGFARMENTTADELPFQPAMVDKTFVESDSEQFFMATPKKVKQLYTKTKFGSLLVEEITGVEAVIDSPDGQISGADVKYIITKHGKKKWSTTVYISTGDTMFIVESNRKIKSKKAKKKFSRLIDQLILDS